MAQKCIQSFNEQDEAEMIEQIPQLFLCCFCSQMVDYQSFIFHYANCKDVFNPEEVISSSIKEDIRKVDQMCSSIYHFIESGKTCLIDILEMNKKAKGIYVQLASLISTCPKCRAKVSFINQQHHFFQCGYDTQDFSDSSTTANSSLIQFNGDALKKKVKGVSLKLKEFSCEEAKTFTHFSMKAS